MDLNSNVGTIAFWMLCEPPAVREALLFDRHGGTNNWGDLMVISNFCHLFVDNGYERAIWILEEKSGDFYPITIVIYGRQNNLAFIGDAFNWRFHRTLSQTSPAPLDQFG